MEQITTKLKKWGNSFGVIIPREVMKEKELKENGEVLITIHPKRFTTVGDILDLAKKNPLPKSKKSVQEIMKEIDKELWGKE